MGFLRSGGFGLQAKDPDSILILTETKEVITVADYRGHGTHDDLFVVAYTL